jgi:hypothetical protein
MVSGNVGMLSTGMEFPSKSEPEIDKKRRLEIHLVSTRLIKGQSGMERDDLKNFFGSRRILTN